jgi:two-component system sensor histidine kinase KdpD
LSNAAFHTPAGTEVKVIVRMERETLIIEVSDRGPGIPSQSIGRLFDRFYRGPSAPTGGSGLGLSLVKGFVEAQGGAVHANNGSGGGAIFSIHLPLAKVPVVPVEPMHA